MKPERPKLLFLLIAILLAGSSPAAQTRPNIIVLLADDMGYGDLSCYGGQAIATPHLDRLAQRGTRYTRFYAASAVCTPSRAGILTGRYPIRFGITRHFLDDGTHLSRQAVTLATLLGKAGYATWHIGKWHLGGLRAEDVAARTAGDAGAAPGPLQFGFEHMLTTIEGPPRGQLLNERRLYRDSGKYLVRDDRRAASVEAHWETIKIDEAIALIERKTNGDRPFFLNLCFDAPHTPYEAAPEPHLSAARATGATGDQLNYRSMISHLDAEVGRLVDSLGRRGLLENTLILFTSDNGAAWEGEVGPFTGGKTDLHDGGLRVPFFAVWPGRIRENAVSLQRGHHADLLPTLCEAAGVSTEKLPLDGVSLLPELTQGRAVKRDFLFWQLDRYDQLQRHYPKRLPAASAGILKGPFKLLIGDRLQPLELFHLENDPRELDNLLGTQPEIARELLTEAERVLAEPRANPENPGSR